MKISIGLMQPEIPQNTGNIARLCVALGARPILVGPLGFDVDDKTVQRAGLDYWKNLNLEVMQDLAEFRAKFSDQRWIGVDPKGTSSFTEFKYEDGDILLFGPESKGLDFLPKNSVHIPMMPNCRSINLCNAVGIVGYEALRNSPELGTYSGSPAWGGTIKY
ncbi:MAG: tRNA (cytidine(34)-2'-O)-methyltransferase [Candidatus Lindowbacteria bacterium]|nr:tRNA (cytidine(34)-2'-O)-methyltransferase [Candidatus Lindowbacteria bacterium]